MTQKFKILRFIERLDEAGGSTYVIILKPAKVKFVLNFNKVSPEE